MITFEESVDIMTQQFDLDIRRLNNEYDFAFEMALVTDSFTSYDMFVYEEVNDTDDGNGGVKKDSFIIRIINYIKKLIADIKASIRNGFMSEEDAITVEKYLQSQTGQMQLEYDINAIQRSVDKQMVAGRKIIQQLAKFIPVEDVEIARFVDTTTNILGSIGKVMVPVSILGTIRRTAMHNTLNGLDKKVSDLKGTFTYGEARQKEAIEAQLKKNMEKSTRKAKVEKQKREVINAIAKMSKDVTQAVGKVTASINRKYQATKKEMAKKGGSKE